MTWEGKFELCEQKNAEVFFKLIGLTDEQIGKAKQITQSTEISRNGDTFTFNLSYGPNKSSKNVFTLGEESTLTTPMGRELKGTVTMVDGKLQGSFDKHKQLTEIDGDGNLKDTIFLGDVEYVRISKRL